MAIPKMKSLKEWEQFFDGRIKASALRSEVQAGRLACYRTRPGCNSKILVSEEQMELWLEEYARRQQAISPKEAAEINQQAN